MLSVLEEDAATTPKPCPVPGCAGPITSPTPCVGPPPPPKTRGRVSWREEAFFPDLAFAENGAHSVPLGFAHANPNQ